jgi:hypothetical protein
MKFIEYNRAAAVEYARRWAFERNPKYMDFSKMGGDCTNFISQCLVAGGMPMNFDNPMGWYYRGSNSRAAAFSGVRFLYNFLTNDKQRRGPFARLAGIADLESGDIIQLSFDGNVFVHSLLVITGGSDPLVTTHSSDTFARPVSTYIFRQIRGLHIVGGWTVGCSVPLFYPN